jgi:hypothetical protein
MQIKTGAIMDIRFFCAAWDANIAAAIGVDASTSGVCTMDDSGTGDSTAS